MVMMMIRYWDSLNGGGYEALGEDFPIKPHHSPSSKILPFILLHFCILFTYFTLWKQYHSPSSKILPLYFYTSVSPKKYSLLYLVCSHVLHFGNSIAHPLENANSRTHCCSPTQKSPFWDVNEPMCSRQDWTLFVKWFEREELWSDLNDNTFIQLFEALTCIFHTKYLIEILNHSVHMYFNYLTLQGTIRWNPEGNFTVDNKNYVRAMIRQSVWSLKFVVTHITLIANLWLFVSADNCCLSYNFIWELDILWAVHISYLWCSESKINFRLQWVEVC